MALRTTYGPANREVKKLLTTTWMSELVTELMPVGSGNFGYFRWWKYTRTRSKSYRYIGMTAQTAKSCAADMNRKFNRKILGQVWYRSQSSSAWTRNAHPTSRDYTYVKCGSAEPNHAKGDSYDVSVDVDEELTYNHTAIQISNEYDEDLPDRFVAFEADPESSEYDNYFSGVGTLDYEE